MVSMKSYTEAKSDQLNAPDLLGITKRIKVREVRFFPEKTEQPLEIFYYGEDIKCWRPSKGMARVLMKFWGDETDNWLNREIDLFCDETVSFGKEKTGGIRIKALSDIQATTDIRVPYARMRYKDYRIEKILPTKQAPVNHADVIDRYILQINNIDNLDEIEAWRASKKYQWAKDNSPDDLPKIDEALQIKENEIKGL